jgi:transglutaminase-like putative cysteine protease/tetratricopeptide (TPR) repeat protein
LTFHLLMTDVRVGDTIDFSYTLQHHEPVFGDRFFARRTTQWDVAVQRSRLRVSTPVTRPVHIAGSESSQPVRSQQGDWETLEWNWSGLPEVSPDPDSPSWYEQHPSIQFSQFADWQEVAQAIMPLFSADAHDADVIAEAQRLKSNTKSDAERVLAVLRFVQEEVRYTGLELGSGAYRPRAPGEVLRRRYGDCKDKVLLAITLLRSLGIKAEPALVSTRWQRHLHERFPSPGDFDHVIVKVLLSGKSYWVDVTETAQGGRLDTFEQADLGDALVLSPGVRQLEQMPSALARQPLIAATGLFDLRSGEDAEGKFTLSTVYRGSEADDMRRKLRRTTAADLGTTYLNYYKNRYPEVRAVHAPEFHDDPVLNEITVNESYLIPHPFGTSTDKQRFEIEAEAVNDFLRAPSRPARNAPLWLPYPSNVSEQITIRLPSYFPVKDDVVQIEDPTFRYESRLTHSGNDVSLECHYQTRTDEVARDRLEEFLKNREKARQDNTLSFTSSPRDTDEKAAAAALKELAKAAELGKAGKFADGDAVLSRMIDSTGFQALTDIQRHSALYLGAALAGAHADYPRSLDLLKRSCAMEQAEAADWELRVRIAHAGHQVADAALALTVLAQRWPNDLTNLDFPTIGRILHDLPEAGSGRYPLLTALRESKYIPEGGDLSAWWRDLALLQLERGETDKARSTLDGITDPYAVISVRADRRFEDVRPKNLPDVGEALELQIRKTKEVIALHPDKLDPIVQLTYLLRYSLRYDEVLKVTDDVLAVVNGPNGRKAYKDFDRYIWILDNRSNAFYGLGRWDEAVAQMVSASHLPESSQDNVSQVINLAGLYNDLGRPEQAPPVGRGSARRPGGERATTQLHPRTSCGLGSHLSAGVDQREPAGRRGSPSDRQAPGPRRKDWRAHAGPGLQVAPAPQAR